MCKLIELIISIKQPLCHRHRVTSSLVIVIVLTFNKDSIKQYSKSRRDAQNYVVPVA